MPQLCSVHVRMCVWFIIRSGVNTNHQWGVGGGSSWTFPSCASPGCRTSILAGSELSWLDTERVDRFCVGETCWLLFGLFYDSVSHTFSSVWYHSNSFIGMLSSHALSCVTSVQVCCSVPSYALNLTLSSILSVLGKSRTFWPYEGSRCFLWNFLLIQSISKSDLPYLTLAFFTDRQYHWIMML